MSYQQDPLYNTANPSTEVVNGEFCYPAPFNPAVIHGDYAENPEVHSENGMPGPLTFGYDNVSLENNSIDFTLISINWPQADWGINVGDVINFNGKRKGISLFDHYQANNFIYNSWFSYFSQIAIDSKGYFIGVGRNDNFGAPTIVRYNLNNPKATNDIPVAIVNPNGISETWSLVAQNYYQFNCVAVDSNDNIYATADDDDGTVSLVKLTSKGVHLWTKAFYAATTKQNILFKDGRLFIVTNISEGPFIFTTLMEFNPENGDILYSKKIVPDQPEVFAYYMTSAVIDNNGNLIAIFDYNDNLSGVDYSYIVSINLDTFEIIFSKRFDVDVVLKVKQINVDKNNNYIFVDINASILYYFDSNLNLITSCNVIDDNIGSSMLIENCVIGYDENEGQDVVYVSTFFWNSVGFTYTPVYITKFDLNGNFLWSYDLNGMNNFYPLDVTNLVYNNGQLYFFDVWGKRIVNLNAAQSNLDIESVYGYVIENYPTYSDELSIPVDPANLTISNITIDAAYNLQFQPAGYDFYYRVGISNTSYINIYSGIGSNIMSGPIANQCFYFEKFNQKLIVTNAINASLYVAPGDYIYANCFWIPYDYEQNYPYVFVLKVVKVTSTKDEANPGSFNNVIEVQGGIPAYAQTWDYWFKFSIVRGRVTGVSLKCTGTGDTGTAHVGGLEVVSGDVFTFSNPAGLTPICGNGAFTVLLQS